MGRADPIKQPDLFLELAKALSHLQFEMIISGDNALRKEIQVKAKEIPNLNIMGGKSFFETLEYFKLAKCLINTSSAEGFPNTFIQAGLTKTPILSINVNPGKMLDTYGMGLCSNGSIEDAKNFLSALTDEKIKAFGENAYRYVCSKNNLKDKIEAYVKIILGNDPT